MYNFLMKNQIWILIILLIIIIVYLIFNSKFRAKVYTLIAKAEVGDISKESLAKAIDKVQEGDLDERMVLVMASIIQLVPVLNLVPTGILTPILNKYTQKAFNRIKLALKTTPKNAIVDLEVSLKSEVVSSAIVSKLNDTFKPKEETHIPKEEIATRLDEIFERVKIAKIQKDHIKKELLK